MPVPIDPKRRRVHEEGNLVTHSNRVLFNACGNIATVDGTPVTFNGAYFTGAWNNGLNIVDRSHPVRVSGEAHPFRMVE
jgi:hypothetical protein